MEKIRTTKPEHLFHEGPVKAIEIHETCTVNGAIELMGKTGFQAKALKKSVDVYEAMIKDPDTTIILGYAGSLSTTGQWKIINWLIEQGFIDILVSTGANISEDIVEATGGSYWKGSANVDNELIFREGFNRYHDVYGSEKEYLEMTELIAEFMVEISSPRTETKDYPFTTAEFLALFGEWLWDDKNIESIAATAWKHNVPVFCPAIQDSPYGDAALIAKSKGCEIQINAMKDYIQFMSLSEQVNKTGVIYIGGGVPKDFIQLFAVTGDLLYQNRKIPNRQGGLGRKGTNEEYYPHSYAVQISLALSQDGGLSGCTFDEAITWGKEDPNGSYVQCFCDATIALPLIALALRERVSEKRKNKNLLQYIQ